MVDVLSAGDLIIREQRRDDDAAVAAIWNAIYPDAPITAEEARREAEGLDPSRYVNRRIVADAQGEGVVAYAGYGHIPWSHHPHKYWFYLYVHPEAERRGVGRRLAETLMDELAERGAERVRAKAREDQTRSIAFLRRAGFVEYERGFESRLDVARCDLTPFRTYPERVAQRGIQITTLSDEMQRRPDCPPAVYQLDCTLDISAPSVEPDLPTPSTYERFIERMIHDPLKPHDAFFLAKCGDCYIGLSNMKRSDADPGLLHQQLTGVLPEYRRLGLATALKVHTVRYAQAHGYREIRTWNSSLNAPMLAINTRLGFVPQPVWVYFLKHLPHVARDAARETAPASASADAAAPA